MKEKQYIQMESLRIIRSCSKAVSVTCTLPSSPCQVWSEGTLLANVSENRPAFLVRGLPPAAPLRLVLYSATPHARSTPVVKYARTLPRPPLHLTGQWVGGWRGFGTMNTGGRGLFERHLVLYRCI